MSDPVKKALTKQPSVSYIEQSLNMITPPQAPVTIYPGPKASLSNLSKVDLELASRLHKLRHVDLNIPSEDEMASRLAQLKGLPPDHYKRKPSLQLYQSPDNRTAVEQSDDLLTQVMCETELESKVPNPDDELMNRLVKLRGGDTNDTKDTKNAQTPPDSKIPLARPPLNNLADDNTLTFNEVEATMQDAASALATDAKSGLDSLNDDPQITKALAQARKKRNAKTKKSKRDPEKYSDTSDSDNNEKSDNKNKKKEEEGNSDNKNKKKEEGDREQKEEVDRLVKMYMDKAEKKKEKKRLHKLKRGEKKEGESDSSESESSMSLDSDFSTTVTSESEKLSDSD